MIGEAPDNLCDGVKPVASGKTLTISGNGYTLYGKNTGWTVVTFVQKVDSWWNESGMPPAGKAENGFWGVNQLGSLYHDENGKHVFYAPGETVDLGHDVKFVVKPVMQEDELQMYVVTAGMRSFSDLPKDFGQHKAEKKRPPLWFMVLFISSPFILLGGIGYGIVRFMRHRRAKKQSILAHQMTGGLPSNPDDLRSP